MVKFTDIPTINEKPLATEEYVNTEIENVNKSIEQLQNAAKSDLTMFGGDIWYANNTTEFFVQDVPSGFEDM